MKIEALLPPSITSTTLPTEPGWALQISDKKLLSKLVGLVSKHFPLPSFKRVVVRDGKCLLLLCKDSQLGKDDVLSVVTPVIGSHVTDLSRDMIISVTLPATIPLTSAQRDSCPWPVSFHPNQELESRLDGTIFSDTERDLICKRMGEVVQTFSETNKNCVMIVDPVRNTEIATETEHPFETIRHAAFVAISTVAKTQVKTLKRKLGEGDYLCRGFDVVMAREPCIMCAMALVHSRVRRLYFNQDREDFGGVTSAKLQEIKALNHHFEVYKVELDHDS
eukprot:sb/3467962/